MASGRHERQSCPFGGRGCVSEQVSRRPTLHRREGRAGGHAAASVALGYEAPCHWPGWVMGAQRGHQERGQAWEARGVAGQLGPVLGGTGQCVGSAGLLQNRGIRAGKDGCHRVTVWRAVVGSQ